MGFLSIRRRRVMGRRRGKRWCIGTASPDQHGVVLVHGKLEHLDDFGFQILEVSVIEIELELEGTIRHTAAALEHVEGAVEDLFEGHRYLSCGWTAPQWHRGTLTPAKTLSRREGGPLNWPPSAHAVAGNGRRRPPPTQSRQRGQEGRGQGIGYLIAYGLIGVPT